MKDSLATTLSSGTVGSIDCSAPPLGRHAVIGTDEERSSAHAGDPEGQLLAWLRHVGDFKENEAERGCALANAAVELPDKDHPARRVIRDYKTALRERLICLCRDAKLTDPERLADEVFLLCEAPALPPKVSDPKDLPRGSPECLRRWLPIIARRGKHGEFARPCHAQPSAELTPKTCAGVSCSTGVPGSRRAPRLRPYHAISGIR